MLICDYNPLRLVGTITGLDYWVGLLDYWTGLLDYWTGLLGLKTGLTGTASFSAEQKLNVIIHSVT